MSRKKHLLQFLILVLTIVTCSTMLTRTLNARETGDFSDLYEDDRKYYGSEKEEKFSINAFLVEKEKWENHYALMVLGFFKLTDYPRYQSIRVLPFYYGLKSKVDNRTRMVLPLLTWYNRLDGTDELTASLPYYSHITPFSQTRSLFYLVWWGRKGSKKSYDSRWTFTPLAYWSSYHSFRTGYRERLQINPLYVYTSDRRKELHSYTLWAPLVPLTYHHRSPRGGHRNFFWLIDYSWRTREGRDEMKRFWFAPLAFWGRERYLHLVPPLFMSWKREGITTETKKPYTRKRTVVTPLFVTHRRNWSSDASLLERVFWFPILPLVYHSKDTRYGSHTNLLWLIDWSTRKNGSLKRFWFFPLWFSRHGPSGYRHFLPPLYLSGYDREGGYRHILPLYLSGYSRTGGYRHILPLYLSGHDGKGSYFHLLPLLHFTWKKRIPNMIAGKKVTYEKRRHLGLLGGWFQNNNVHEEEDRTELISRSIWFPFIPVFYHRYSRHNGRHTNILWLIDWSTRQDSSLKRFWFMPLVFYEGKPGGYRVFAPFYFRPGQRHEKRGLSFGLFHYHRWSENQETTWAWPWYSWKNFRKKHHYRHALPIYYSWKLKDNQGTMIFPVYLSYKTKRRSLTLNLLGLSKSLATGPFTPSLGVGKYRGKWYLDTDFSWFYDLASIATRVTINAPDEATIRKSEKNNTGIAAIEDRETPDSIEKKSRTSSPALSKKRTFDRDNSYNFFGFKLLFGWLAYERGDTRRHFRLLPLSWFTWDTASDDRIYVAPPFFLWYKSEETAVEYFVLFPFYGSQREKGSWMQAWLLNLYWDEYNAKEKLREHDILWPIVNWYSSPKRAGWRIFPLVWHRKKFYEERTKEQYISPLFYSSAVFSRGEKIEKTLYRHIINPLFYHRKKIEKGSSYRRLAIPLLPLFYHGTRQRHYRYKILPPPGKTGEEAAPPGEEAYTDSSTTHFLFPFYVFNGWERSGEKEKPDIERGTLIGLPLLYYSYRGSRNRDGSYDRHRRFFLLGYHWYAKPQYRKHSILFGLYKYESYLSEDKSVHSLLWGIINFTSAGESGGSSRFFPLYSYRSHGESGRLWLLLGLAGVRSWYERGDTSFYSLWGLFHFGTYYKTKRYYSGGSFQSYPLKISRSWFFPLYFHRSASGERGGSSYRRSLHWNPLMFLSREEQGSADEKKYYSRFWFPVLPLVYRYASQREVHWNILGFIDGYYSRDGKRGRSFFLPLYFYNRTPHEKQVNVLGLFDNTWRRRQSFHRFMLFPLFASYKIRGDESHLFLPPLLSYFGKGKDWRTTFLLGTYWHHSPDYSRQNLWLLFDHRYYRQENLDSYRFLLGTFRVDVSPEIRRFRLFYGMLARYDNYVNQPKYSFDVLYILAHARRDTNHFSHSLQPLWYYSRTGDEWTFWSIAGLTYLDHSSEGAFDLGLLGLAYYRNEKINEGKDRRMVLLGTLWHEVKRPVRRYHSMGMLWGLLWNYETEEETGFKKFSILKGLYKRTEINGKVKHKVLWVF